MPLFDQRGVEFVKHFLHGRPALLPNDFEHPALLGSEGVYFVVYFRVGHRNSIVNNNTTHNNTIFDSSCQEGWKAIG